MEKITGIWRFPEYSDLEFKGELQIQEDGSATLTIESNEATRENVGNMPMLMQADEIVGPEENPIVLENPRISESQSNRGNQGNGGSKGLFKMVIEGEVDLGSI